MTLLEATAARHRLRVRPDGCGEKVIPGRCGQIFDYGEGKLAVLFMPDPKGERAPASRRWQAHKRKLLAAGFTVHQDCDAEGTALFDPADPKQVRLAVRVAGVKPRQRRDSEAQKTVYAATREARLRALARARAERRCSEVAS